MLTRKILFGLAIAVLASSSLVAQDETKAKKTVDPTAKLKANVMKSYKKVKLTDEQQTQVSAIVDKHAESFLEAKKAQEMLLSAEHKAKKKAAMAQAKADGVKGKAASAAAYEAMGLTEDEMAKFTESKEKVSAVANLIRGEIKGLLTEDQLAMMSKKKGKKAKGEKGEKAEKKKMKEAAAQEVSLKLPNMT